MYCQSIANFAQAVGLPVAILLLLLAYLNLRHAKKVAEAGLWLELRAHLFRFHDIHCALTPEGVWRGCTGCPAKVADWRRLEAYMGLFEHCAIMLRKGIVDRKTFESVYEYKLKNILANPYIVQAKLICAASGWEDFNWLVEWAGLLPLRGTKQPVAEWPKKHLPDGGSTTSEDPGNSS